VDEVDVRQRARKFVASALAGDIPVMGAYAQAVNARLRSEQLDRGEAAFAIPNPKGGYVITVNENESEERRRFSICHEIGHIVLGLPTAHVEQRSWSYAKRHLNEIMCDWFATELLMPYDVFSKSIPAGEPSVQVIEKLGKQFGSSFPATASRYASLAPFPCAYIIMEGGVVRYAAVNAALRRKGIRVPGRCPIPPASIAHKLRAAGNYATEIGEVSQDVWMENCDRGYDLMELSRHYGEYDETISILWCSEDDLPQGEVDRFNRRIEDDDGLEDLTGELSWEKHGPRRRR
jgi:hypothetical protein